jgi:hypothetical protein
VSNFSVETFRPYALEGDLVRYGNKSDGGYIVNTKYLKLSNVLYTYGVGGEVSFEIDLLKYNPNYKIHLYDPTISQFPEIHGNVIRHEEGLASSKQDKYDNFLNHLSINQDTDKKALLKIDIEGGEFDFFKNTDINSLSNVVQMIVEFHIDRAPVDDFIECLNKINEKFICIHIHGNNHSNITHINNIEFPVVPEFTFVNRKYIKEKPSLISKKNYPIKDLDCVNGGIHRDWSISFT